MSRYTEPGSFQETVQRVIKAAGGVEAAADQLMVSITTVSNGTALDELRPGGFGGNYLARLARWRPACALPLAEFFAAHAGGVFQPIDIGGQAVGLDQVSAEFHVVLQGHFAAHSAGSDDPSGYTRREAQEQIANLRDLVAKSMAMIAALQPIAEGR